MTKMKCRCGAPPVWVEMPEEHTHRYSVRCSKCEKQAKWGSQAELERSIDAGEDGSLLTYAEQLKPPPDPFAPFYRN